jgi:Tol biopolymer transport system component
MTKQTSLIIGAVAVWVVAATLSAQTPAARFEEGRYKEHVEGDLVGAIAVYKEVAAHPQAERPLVAKALLHAAACYDRLGRDDGRGLYERIVREFADQADAVRQAQTALSKFRAPAPTAARGLSARRLATFPSESWFNRPTGIASDGRMAYVGQFDGKGNWIVVRRNLTTGEDRTLYSAPRSRDLVLSPDGSRLAISHPLSDGRSAVVLIDTQGNGAQKIEFTASEIRPAAWSPDRKELLVRARAAAAVPIGEAGFSLGTFSLASIDVATGKLHTLREMGRRDLGAAAVLGASYTNDAADVVYDVMADDRERRVINVVSKNGSEHRTLIDGPGNSAVLGFAPGSKDLLFLSDRSGSIDAYAIRFQNGKVVGEAQLVKDNVGLIQGAGWSGANYFYFPRVRRSVFVGKIDMDTGAIRDRRVVSSRYVDMLFPALLSPDGSRLVYGSAPRPLADGRPSLVFRDMKSGRERELELYPHVAWLVTAGTWSPEGDAVVLTGYSPSGEQVSARVAVDTGEVRIVSHKLCWEALAGGVHIICSESAGRPNVNRLFKLDWRTGVETPVLTAASGVYFRSVGSPDGKRVAYLTEGGTSLAIRDLNTSEDRVVWHLPRPGVGNFIGRWLDADRLLVLKREHGCCSVSVVRLEGPDAGVSTLNWNNNTIPTEWDDPRLMSPQPWPQLAFADWSRSIELWVLENLASTRSAK